MQKSLVDFTTHLVDDIEDLRWAAEHGYRKSDGGDINTLTRARNLWAFTIGGRGAEQNEHERMTSEEFTLYTHGRCSHQTEYGNGRPSQYCSQPVSKMYYGKFLQRAECEEHVQDIIDNYGSDHLD